MSPDKTAAGNNRQVNLTELRKDWKRAKASRAKEELSGQFKNTKKILRARMVVHGSGASKKGETSEVEFTVALTEDGWKIVSTEAIRRK